MVDEKEWEHRELKLVGRLREHFGKQAPSYQRYQELRQRKIRLKGNGAEMACGDAEAMLQELRRMQEEQADEFAELVRSVRPQAATRLPEPSAALVIARSELEKGGYLVADGLGLRPEPRVAALLDAAYTETKEGVILREAAIYPDPGFYQELVRVRDQWAEEVVRLAVKDAQEDRSKRRGGGSGPAL
jgi:hypothetical protein